MGPTILDREHWVPGRAPAGLGPGNSRAPWPCSHRLQPSACDGPRAGILAPCPPPEPSPASPSAFRWPPRCPGQTRCARAGWTQRQRGWTGPRARTRGSCPPGRWSLWRDCQGLGSAPPRHGYGYCSQGRTRLWEEGGQTDRRREKKDQVGKKQEMGERRAADKDQEPGARASACKAAPAPPPSGASIPMPAHQAPLPSCPPPSAVPTWRPPNPGPDAHPQPLHHPPQPRAVGAGLHCPPH